MLSLHGSIVSVYGPPWLHFEPLKLLNFDLMLIPIRFQHFTPTIADPEPIRGRVILFTDLDPVPEGQLLTDPAGSGPAGSGSYLDIFEAKEEKMLSNG
jgi:hypothetical protein